MKKKQPVDYLDDLLDSELAGYKRLVDDDVLEKEAILRWEATREAALYDFAACLAQGTDLADVTLKAGGELLQRVLDEGKLRSTRSRGRPTTDKSLKIALYLAERMIEANKVGDNLPTQYAEDARKKFHAADISTIRKAWRKHRQHIYLRYRLKNK